MNLRSFLEGKSFDAYEFLGCHPMGGLTAFRVYAPAAKAVSVTGDFNGWRETPMARAYGEGVWECLVRGAQPGSLYKYRITRADGRCLDHCDPFGFGMELRPGFASVVRDLNAYTFHDGDWMRSRSDGHDRPVNIYEVHAGSWMRHTHDGNRWYTYGELADRLIPYALEQGYNYLELMPLGEHPLDESWGYQVSCPYSPTSRYGSMDQLKAFVDRCHQAGLGVLLDFVPAHFAVDDFALADFDGTPLFEYPHPDVGDSEWGSKNYNYGRGEVRSYLQSNANYWLKEFHFDGLRMDAVRNLIYWQGDENRGENPGGIGFLREMNAGLKALHPTAILAAEDSTVFPGATRPIREGGLGFDYKWDMGWMNDTLAFFSEPPAQRTADYHRLTFSMMYFYDERFLLPLSHDEVVHGKGSIAGKMHGSYDERFPQVRLLYAYMMTHPGKKLSFMGGEFAQLREWDEGREQDWGLLAYPVHDAFHRYIRDLNRLYLREPALSARDYDRSGFRWIDCHQEEACVYAYLRMGGDRAVAVFLNASDKTQRAHLRAEGFELHGLLLNSDDAAYGGSGAQPVPPRREESALSVELPPYSAAIYAARVWRQD